MVIIIIKVEIEAEEILTKEVKKHNESSGRIYLPNKWIGKEVKVCLLKQQK